MIFHFFLLFLVEMCIILSDFDRESSKKYIRIIMITTYGLKKNMYSGIAHNQVILDDLFR